MCYAQQDGATQTGVRPELKLLKDWTNDENITGNGLYTPYMIHQRSQ